MHEIDQSYYDVELPIEGGTGTFHFFVLDTNALRINADSRAAQTSWLKSKLESSTATWKFVSIHHPAYNSTARGDDYLSQLPYQQWGAHAVFMGHAHTYERTHVTDAIQEDFPYILTGLGGLPPHSFRTTTRGSRHQFGGSQAANGATRVILTDDTATIEYLAIDDGDSGRNGGRLIDSVTIHQNDLPQAPSGNRLVEQGAEWFYLDDGSNQGTAWKEVGFDPIQAGWKSGNAQLGYGNNFETTMVDYGTDAATKHITTYFRRNFEVTAENLASFEKLTLGLVRDDGAAVYLNGTEIRRDNLFANAPYDSLATRTVDSFNEYIKTSTDLGVGLLQLGTNVLAVEVHQRTQDSPDLAFDLTLDGGRIDYGAVTPGVATGFSEAGIGTVAFARDAGERELAWEQHYISGSNAEVHNTVNGSPISGNQLVASASTRKIISEPIDVRNFRDLQVSIDFRAYTPDNTGFEPSDTIQLSLLTSSDGISFTESVWETLQGGGEYLPSGMAAGSIDGDFTTMLSPVGFVSDETKVIKIGLRFSVSSSEYFFFDNFSVSGFATADFNSDGNVDSDDLTTLRANYGALTGGTYSSGDSDQDGDVDGADFLAWQRQYKENLIGSSASLTRIVPEPSTVTLTLIMAVTGLSRMARAT